MAREAPAALFLVGGAVGEVVSDAMTFASLSAAGLHPPTKRPRPLDDGLESGGRWPQDGVEKKTLKSG